jgi:hypothetical protein
MAFSKIKDLRPGDRVLDRGRYFVVKRIVVHSRTGQYYIIDTDGERHGPYHPDEWIGTDGEETTMQWGVQQAQTRVAPCDHCRKTRVLTAWVRSELISMRVCSACAILALKLCAQHEGEDIHGGVIVEEIN